MSKETTSTSSPPSRGREVFWGFRLWVRALIATFVFVLVSLGIFTHRETTEQEEAANLVEHTHLVIEALERIPAGIAVGESGVRGYSIQPDDAFLAEVEPAIGEVEDAMTTVRHLTVDRAVQQARLDSLEPMVRRRLAILRERADILRTDGRGEITAEARHLTQQIRATVADMAHEEEMLLVVRRSVREAHTRRLRIISPLGIFASIAIVIVTVALVYDEARRRQRAEIEADEQRRRLRSLVKESALMLQFGEMLSACRSVSEANVVVEQFAPRFFTDASGAICMLNESQNLLEAHVRWGGVTIVPTNTFPPDECWALRRGKPHRAQPGDGTRCAHLAGGNAATTVCYPLLANGHVVGTLHVTDGSKDAEQTERRGMLLGEQVGMALSNLRLRETLRNQSIRDALTGLFNRRYNDETLAREIHRAGRESSPVSVLVMDVDFFKKFNDSFGHQAGDRVLATLGSLLRKRTRGSDMASRIGGEELAVVLPGASLEDAIARAEDIRQAVSKMPVVHEGKDIGPVTLSIGVAAFPQHGASADEIIRVADTALYRAKREGRNRVVVAD